MLPGASGPGYGPEYDESGPPPFDGEPGVYEDPNLE
jgi:hypothetical protein